MATRQVAAGILHHSLPPRPAAFGGAAGEPQGCRLADREVPDPDRRSQVHRSARALAALLDHAAGDSPRSVRATASASTAPRSGASRRSMSPTCCSSRIRHGIHRSVLREPDTVAHLRRASIRSCGKPYSRDPRYIAKQGRDPSEGHRDRGHLLLRSRARVLHLRLDPLRAGPALRLLLRRIGRGRLELGRRRRRVRRRQLGYKSRFKEGYFPVPPHDTLQDIRSEIVLELMKAGIQVEVHHHEVATAGQNEIDMRFAPLTRMADNVMIYKYVVQERRAPAQQGRDVHAQADLRGQRQRHALPPEPVEGREEPLLRPGRLGADLADVPLVHRRVCSSMRRR